MRAASGKPAKLKTRPARALGREIWTWVRENLEEFGADPQGAPFYRCMMSYFDLFDGNDDHFRWNSDDAELEIVISDCGGEADGTASAVLDAFAFYIRRRPNELGAIVAEHGLRLGEFDARASRPHANLMFFLGGIAEVCPVDSDGEWLLDDTFRPLFGVTDAVDYVVARDATDSEGSETWKLSELSAEQQRTVRTHVQLGHCGCPTCRVEARTG